jgi:hypothetical protein
VGSNVEVMTDAAAQVEMTPDLDLQPGGIPSKTVLPSSQTLKTMFAMSGLPLIAMTARRTTWSCWSRGR